MDACSVYEIIDKEKNNPLDLIHILSSILHVYFLYSYIMKFI